MDPRFAIWNALHDGEITVVASESADTLVMFVNIPYLRERITPLGDSFVLRLSGFRKSEMTDKDGKKKGPEWADISKSGILINSTDSEAMPVKIATNMGYLILDFDNITIALDSGRLVDYLEVDQACVEYWEAFAKRSRKSVDG